MLVVSCRVCMPPLPEAPAAMSAVLGPDGLVVRDGAVTPDGYVG
jgi:hypothetical protein